MNVSTSIIPFDPIEAGAGTVAWLRAVGISVPTRAGRAPLLEEVLDALRTFPGVPIECDPPVPPARDFCIRFGDAAGPNGGVRLEGMLDEGRSITLWIHGARDEWMMLAIVKRLSQRCGPQLVFTDAAHADDFSIVTPETEIEAESARRRERWNAARPDGPPARVIRPLPPFSDA